MNILFLGKLTPPQRTIVEYLLREGNSVVRYEKKLDAKVVEKKNYDFLVSFGYSYIVSNEVLNLFKGNAINLHISYLPWNKGSDPNLWSVLENTPKGVTIHIMESKLDAGAILCQKYVLFDDDETFRTSYYKLQIAIVELFKENWEAIKSNKITHKKQNGVGSFHKKSDKNNYLKILKDGWDTSIKSTEGKAI